MIDPPRIIDPPPPRPFVTAVLIAVALVLLLLHLAIPGLVVVALALVSSLYDLFGRRPAGGSGAAANRGGPTAGTS
jgi:hypothetical protein